MRKLLLFILFFPAILLCQVEVLDFNNLDYKAGLCNDHVNALAEDDYGYIWLGTQNGLEVYDGGILETLKHSDIEEASLSSNDVSTIFKGQKNKMYLGTWGDGINTVDMTTKTVTRLPKHPVYKKNFVKSIIEDKNRDLWIGSFGGGLYKTDYLHQKYQHVFVSGNASINGKFDFIQGMVAVRDDIYVISWRDGLGILDKDRNILFDAIDHKNEKISIKNFSYVLNYGDELILSTTWGDMYTYHTKTKVFKYLTTFRETKEHRNRITSFSFETENVIWVSTEAGLFSFDLKTKQTKAIHAGVNGKKYDQNLCSIKDSRDILWFGTSGQGVNRYDKRNHQLNKIRLSDTNPLNVNCVYPLNKNRIMFGTNKGIVIYDIVKKTTSKLVCKGGEAKNLAENEITYIHTYGDSFLIGTTNGLYTMSQDFECDVLEVRDGNHFYASSINDIKQVGDEIWVSSFDNGLLIINPNDSTFSKHYSTRYNQESNLSSDELYCVFEYSSTKILIGTQEGIEVYNKTKDTFEILKFDDKSSKEIMYKVKSIVQDASGNIWIGSHEGLWRCDGNLENLEKVDMDLSFSNQSVQGLLEADGRVWVTTTSDMYSVHVNTGNVKYYNMKEGLISYSFPHAGIYRYDENTLYFSNGNGVSVLDLNAIDLEDAGINIRIKNVISNNEEVSIKNGKDKGREKIKLFHYQDKVSINVSILDFSVIHDDIFKYKLEGFEDNWNTKNYDQSIIEYNNLVPGNYLLKMSIYNKNKVLIKSKEYDLIVRDPFWNTIWFQIFILMIIGLLFLLAWHLRLNSINNQKKNLEVKVEQRTHELAIEKEKLKSKNKELFLTMEEVYLKQNLITSNIKYASLIQKSILPSESNMSNYFKDVFILSSPKDIVSGDFYWNTKVNDKSIFIVGDCTGHGVSGALMSVYITSLLNLIIIEKKITDSNKILDELHLKIIDTFQQEGNSIDDSLDLTVLVYNHTSNMFYLSGALTKAVIIQSGELNVYKGDRFPIGGQGSVYKNRKKYSYKEFNNTDETVVYLYSDGYQDQFHHETNKKLMHRNFLDQLQNHHELPLYQQRECLEKYFMDWKGLKDQTDDMTVIGLKL